MKENTTTIIITSGKDGVEVEAANAVSYSDNAMICFSAAMICLMHEGKTEREAMQFFHSSLTKTLLQPKPN